MRELILTFHGIGEAPREAEMEAPWWIPIPWFEAILDALPKDGVRLSFDDGNASDVERVLPRLLARGLVARFFVLAGRREGPRWLTESQLLELRDCGMPIGSHGLEHTSWRTLPTPELMSQLSGSRHVLEELLGEVVDSASCPFGAYDRRVLQCLRRTGFRQVYTSAGGPARGGSWLVPRNTVDRFRTLEQWLELVRGWPGMKPPAASPIRRLYWRLR